MATLRGLALIASACISASLACNGRFEFGGSDAATLGEVATDAYAESAADDLCAAPTCPWTSSCELGACSLICPQNATCVGSCGDDCTAHCDDLATCALTTGARAAVTCDFGTCTLTLGAEATANCTEGGACHVRCTAACTVDCAAAVDCDLQCAGAAAPTAFTGNASCP